MYSGREVSLREQNIEWWSGTDANAPCDSVLNRLFASPTGLIFEEIAHEKLIGQRLEMINKAKSVVLH
ncbi:hypothetical protein ASU33_05905 [Solirubrum puertoriconensis]|uniref:Uncharacterized protein n=1 Tax=Solirubrum puertoriconensis TaxID=1751427 RepID=A0A9X0HJD6_SOLP1|nr:hypothetical protein ASU33_05905 [Solirubrum puertoriconensis]